MLLQFFVNLRRHLPITIGHNHYSTSGKFVSHQRLLDRQHSVESIVDALKMFVRWIDRWMSKLGTKDPNKGNITSFSHVNKIQ